MLHALRFDRGQVSYRNRWVQTAALGDELAAGQALWTGLKEAPRRDTPDEPLKNTSNTDVKFHTGRLITMWYRSGLPYAVDPITLAPLGPALRAGSIKAEIGAITCARLAIQGRDDEYGRLRQIRGNQRQVPQTCLLALPDYGHAPQHNQHNQHDLHDQHDLHHQADAVIAAVRALVQPAGR